MPSAPTGAAPVGRRKTPVLADRLWLPTRRKAKGDAIIRLLVDPQVPFGHGPGAAVFRADDRPRDRLLIAACRFGDETAVSRLRTAIGNAEDAAGLAGPRRDHELIALPQVRVELLQTGARRLRARGAPSLSSRQPIELARCRRPLLTERIRSVRPASVTDPPHPQIFVAEQAQPPLFQYKCGDFLMVMCLPYGDGVVGLRTKTFSSRRGFSGPGGIDSFARDGDDAAEPSVDGRFGSEPGEGSEGIAGRSVAGRPSCSCRGEPADDGGARGGGRPGWRYDGQ